MAVALGVAVMISPLLVLPQQVLIGTPQDLSPLGEGNYSTMDTRNLVEAAQTYGKIDVGPEPFQMSLYHAALITAAGFVTALWALLILRRRLG